MNIWEALENLKARARMRAGALAEGDFRELAGAGLESMGLNPQTGKLENLGFGLGGIIAGPAARTADKAMLKIAKEAEERGMSMARIFDATGWAKGKDGKWRFEIDDSAARFNVTPATNRETDVVAGYGDLDVGPAYGRKNTALEHPALVDAYDPAELAPHMYLRDQTGVFEQSRGGFNPDTKTVTLFAPTTYQTAKGVMGHELQHAVQGTEGFARGGSPDIFRTPENLMEQIGRDLDVLDDAREIRRLMDKRGLSPKEAEVAYGELLAARGESRAPLPGARVEAGLNPFDELNRLFNIGKRDLAERFDSNMLAWEKYQRLAGEVEARNVQGRMSLSADDRRMLPWWLTEDVPRDDQILRGLAGEAKYLVPLGLGR